MTDPLSITAGVVGFIGAAAQISSLLIKGIRSVKEAPRQTDAALTEVSEISSILCSLEAFLLGEEIPDESRACLLQVDQLVTIISSCVLTFSELEKLLDELRTEDQDILDCIKWATRESAITAIIQRLQNHKASLSLILAILNASVFCYWW